MVVDLGRHGILVNTILPGFVGPTGMMQHAGTPLGEQNRRADAGRAAR
jgi:NAD(P)-dependent dehydrogenase (short-subunit alcohol dehydrogenase family)